MYRVTGYAHLLRQLSAQLSVGNLGYEIPWICRYPNHLLVGTQLGRTVLRDGNPPYMYPPHALRTGASHRIYNAWRVVGSRVLRLRSAHGMKIEVRPNCSVSACVSVCDPVARACAFEAASLWARADGKPPRSRGRTAHQSNCLRIARRSPHSCGSCSLPHRPFHGHLPHAPCTPPPLEDARTCPAAFRSGPPAFQQT